MKIPFLGEWTSINPSYFDVNYRGTIGFDTLPYQEILWVFPFNMVDLKPQLFDSLPEANCSNKQN